MGREVLRLSHAKAVQVCSRSDGVGYIYAYGFVEVDGLNYEKQVLVRFTNKISKGLWHACRDLPATYQDHGSDGYDRWYFNTGNIELHSPRGTVEFRLAPFCTIGGETWWDNNSGNDYRIGAGENTVAPRIVLGHDKVVLDAVAAVLRNGKISFSGSVIVRTHPESRKVLVRYTTNAWAGFGEIGASYAFPIYGSSMEKWAFETLLDSGVGEIRFAIAYANQEGVFWDNRFGGDYSITVPGIIP